MYRNYDRLRSCTTTLGLGAGGVTFCSLNILMSISGELRSTFAGDPFNGLKDG